jgi:hypothetical protein
MEVIAMVGPLVYDLAQLHVAEVLAEREKDRLAAQVVREPRFRIPKLDIRRMLPPLWPSTGGASARA